MLNSIALTAVLSLLTGVQAASYAPSSGKCPASNPLIPPGTESDAEGVLRKNTILSESEYDWILSRKEKVKPKLISFLNGLNMSDYKGDNYFDNYFKNNASNYSDSPINIGLSFSGGSFRALLTGAGEMTALDSRTNFSSNATALQGLMDSSTYISGLSGGSLLVASVVFQNWTSVENILEEKKIWNFTEAPVSTSISFWTELLSEVKTKSAAGYDITLIDLFGRILSKYMFTNYADNGIDLQWSEIQDLDAFKSHEMPFPMILATGGVSSNESDFANNVWEISPYEFGSWSPFVGGFANIEYMGTSLKAGKPSNSTCTTNFDNAGLMAACSSDFFGGMSETLSEITSGNASVLSDLLEEFMGSGSGSSSFNISSFELNALLNMVSTDRTDILFALIPNPFYESTLPSNTSDIPTNKTLKLVDGGMFNESVPLDPFLVPARAVDIVFAYDNSGVSSTNNYPDGSTLLSTRERWHNSFPDDNFYDIPDTVDDFIAKGLNTKPVFFGCNGTELVTDQIEGNDTDEFNYMKPLLVYIPNANTTSMSNTSDVVLSYDQRSTLVKGGFEVATRFNFTKDDEFAQCVGCAILRRTEERRGIEPGEQCRKCFERYCYSSGNEKDSDLDEENLPTSLYGSISTTATYSTSNSSATATSSSSAASGSSTSTTTKSSTSKAGALRNAVFSMPTALLCLLSLII